MENKLHIVTADVIKTIAENSDQLIYNEIKNIYSLHHQKKTACPLSHFLWVSEVDSYRIIALPAAIHESSPVAGIKWIASRPQNVLKGLNRASAMIILNDYETGYPVACMEGSIISALRTIYSAFLALDYIKNSRKLKCLGIVGNGYIAKTFCSLSLIRDYAWDYVYLFDIDSQRASLFQQEISGFLPKTKIAVKSSLESLVRDSDTLLLTTTSKEPYINNTNWFRHNPIVLNISLRDLSPEIILSSNNIVDDIDHVSCANTSVHLATQKCGSRHFINGVIAQLMNGDIIIPCDKTTVFSPMGMGILDIGVSNLIYKKALELNQQIEIPNFFIL
jgi:2,3-diaminopropionate biosynthesis protein SbnB